MLAVACWRANKKSYCWLLAVVKCRYVFFLSLLVGDDKLTGLVLRRRVTDHVVERACLRAVTAGVFITYRERDRQYGGY